MCTAPEKRDLFVSVFPLFEFILVRAEKVAVDTDIRKLCPTLIANGTGIKVVYFRAFHREDERAVRRDDELTAVKPRRILEKPRKLKLIFGRKAVFRLVEKIERIFLYLDCKIAECAFPVGFFGHILRQATLDILAFRRVTRFVVAAKLIVFRKIGSR